MDPKWKQSAIEEVEDLGDRLAGAVDTVLAQKRDYITGDLAFAYREIDIPLAKAADRAQLTNDAKSADRFMARRARQMLRDLDAGRPPRSSYPYPVQTWRLGERLLVVALGGEAVVDYSLRLKLKFGAEKTWVSAYTNDVMAYVPSRRVLLEGGYEGGDSNQGRPADGGPMSSQVDAAAAQARHLFGGHCHWAGRHRTLLADPQIVPTDVTRLAAVCHWFDRCCTRRPPLSAGVFDHQRLTFYHNGIRRGLTNVHGDPIQGVLA